MGRLERDFVLLFLGGEIQNSICQYKKKPHVAWYILGQQDYISNKTV